MVRGEPKFITLGSEPRAERLSATHARKRVLGFADDHQITVADRNTGEVLSIHLIEPNKSCWRNQTNSPARWPSSPN